ncbi:MAG: hypothetical protein GW893_10220 [Armatimonadetes bacterium]|nr:hypothetical protein [Armatimonadota bacterium]
MRLGQAPTLCSTRRGAIACHYLSDPFARVPIAKYGWVRQWRQQGQGDFHDSPGCRADQHVPSRDQCLHPLSLIPKRDARRTALLNNCPGFSMSSPRTLRPQDIFAWTDWWRF